MCRIEIDLVLESGSNFTCFCAGVKIDFGSLCGPKITWFHLLIEIDLVFRVGIEVDLVFVCRLKITCFKWGDRLS